MTRFRKRNPYSGGRFGHLFDAKGDPTPLDKDGRKTVVSAAFVVAMAVALLVVIIAGFILS